MIGEERESGRRRKGDGWKRGQERENWVGIKRIEGRKDGGKGRVKQRNGKREGRKKNKGRKHKKRRKWKGEREIRYKEKRNNSRILTSPAGPWKVPDALKSLSAIRV